MQREEAIIRLRAAESDIRAFGVRNLYLYGSVARGEAGAQSDIDIFVDGASDAFYTLPNYLGVYRRLVSAFPGVDVGYSTREGLSKYIRPRVEREAVRVF